MNPKDRACFNCEGSEVRKIPIVGEEPSESAYWGIVECKQKLSDHYQHYVSLQHMCAWHSDAISEDSRYPNWRESIDK